MSELKRLGNYRKRFSHSITSRTEKERSEMLAGGRCSSSYGAPVMRTGRAIEAKARGKKAGVNGR
jgi:hypothetical protein